MCECSEITEKVHCKYTLFHHTACCSIFHMYFRLQLAIFKYLFSNRNFSACQYMYTVSISFVSGMDMFMVELTCATAHVNLHVTCALYM